MSADLIPLAAYRPFITALPIWDYWPLLILPLCLGVAVVYKSIRCATMAEVWRQTAVVWLWILSAMAAGGAILAALVALVTRLSN